MPEAASAKLSPQSAPESWLATAVQHRRTAAAIAGLALLVQALGRQNGDNAWFITFAEHVLDGAAPYVDIGDPNLPFAFLIYMPAVLLGRLLGVAPEAVTVALVFVGAAASAALAGHILRQGGAMTPSEAHPLLCAGAFALLLMPAFCFAEREHVALLLMLPLFATLAVRARDGAVARGAALVAGLGGGLALGIKPYYALALVLPWSWVLWRRRDMRALVRPETVGCAVAAVVSAATVVLLFPAYVTQALPVAAEVYGPARASFATLLVSPLLVASAVILAALAAMLRGAPDDRATIAALGALGFLLTFLVQGKGWMNHAYPGLALALLALVPILLRVPPPRRFVAYVAVPFIAVAPFLCGLLEDIWSREEYPGLSAAVERLAPAHPTMIGLTEQLDVVHPLVRHVGGRFVGRQNCLWVAASVRYLLERGGLDPARREALLRDRVAEETTFAADVARERPDVILSESPALVAWSRREPALAHVLDRYRSVETVGDIEIWLRQP
jgi:hypothetical protein